MYGLKIEFSGYSNLKSKNMKKDNNLMEDNMSTDRGLGLTKTNKTTKDTIGKKKVTGEKARKTKRS